MKLTKSEIVAAAIDILNRSGFEGLTMRTLAAELRVQAASLYWHIKDKRELLGEIAEALSMKIELPVYQDDPRAYLTAICVEFRACLLPVRDSVLVLEQSPPVTPRRVQIIRIILENLRRLGVKKKHVLTAANLLNNYVLSFVADELRMKAHAGPDNMDILTVFGMNQSSETDFDTQFLYGLNVIFKGLTK